MKYFKVINVSGTTGDAVYGPDFRCYVNKVTLDVLDLDDIAILLDGAYKEGLSQAREDSLGALKSTLV
jgi:hypothetical protein